MELKNPPYNQGIKVYVIPIICLGLLLLGACSGTSEKRDTSRKRNRAIKVDYFIPQWTSVVKRGSSTGTFVANEKVTITSEVAGKIVRLPFNEGTRISQGDLIAVLDSELQQAQRKKIKLNIALAQKNWERAQELLKIDAITQKEADNIKSNLQTLKAELDRINVEISKHYIRAPFSGIIGVRNISVGAYVNPGTEITTLVQTAPIKLDFTVPAGIHSLIKEGETVNFISAAVEDTFTAEIYLKSPIIDPNTRSVKIRAIADNPDNLFLPGGYAEVFYGLNVSDSSALVPAEALIPVLNGQKLLLIENGKVKSLPVEVGIRTENAIAITDGLNKTDTVILTGLMILKENNPVVADKRIKLDGQ